MSWNPVGSTPKTVFNQLQDISVADSNTGDVGENDTVYIPTKLDAHSHVFGGNTTLSSNTTLGSSTLTEIVASRFEGNLTIDSGATLTVQGRSRGLLMLVQGDLDLKDCSISMSKSGYGHHPSEKGYPLVVLPDIETRGTDALLPLYGGAKTQPITVGGNGSGSQRVAGKNGLAGANGASGTGGCAAVIAQNDATAAGSIGAVGSLYCGGSGGGAVDCSNDTQATVSPEVYGRRGGDADNTSTGRAIGGGAGNPGGSGAGGGQDGESGCGGLIIIICEGEVTLGNSAVIEANGADGGDGSGSAGGGGSGGGSINIFYNVAFNNSGSLEVNGGVGGTGGFADGGDGGAGSTNTTQVTL